MRHRPGAKYRGTAPVPTPIDTTNPLAYKNFWVDPANDSIVYADSIRSTDQARASVIDKIGTNPVVPWWYPTQTNAQTYISTRIDQVISDGAFPVFVLYQIPYRDVSAGLSGGGMTSQANYDTMIDGVAAGIGGRECAVILEPDALAELDDLAVAQGATARSQRVAMLSRAVTVLTAAGASVYIDAGNVNFPAGSTSAQVAAALIECNVAGARGFSLNVSNFYTTSQTETRGDAIHASLISAGVTGAKGYVVDTSRNGNGRGDTWCNPVGRALGPVATAITASAYCDAYLWIKTPGRSDGDADFCGVGAPPAGTYWPDYAYQLAFNS